MTVLRDAFLLAALLGLLHCSEDDNDSAVSDAGAGADGDSDGDSDSDIDVQASCEGLVTDTSVHPMTALAKPEHLLAATDPEFGTCIVRVTDVADETGGEVTKPLYSTVQAWNADESYLMHKRAPIFSKT